jgi:hypothetical protein
MVIIPYRPMDKCMLDGEILDGNNLRHARISKQQSIANSHLLANVSLKCP